MSFFQEFKELVKSILSWIFLLLGSSFFFFLFGFKKIEILGRNLFLPLPSVHSFSARIFEKIQQDLVPSGVRLIVTNPLSAFLAQITISLILAFILTLPFFLYGIIKYLSPALFEKEKKIIIRVLLPSVFLFFIGCLFAYLFLIPLTFKMLYPYASVMGAVPFFSMREFISLVFGMMMAVGIMFSLPVLMVFLSFLGIVGPDFWKNNRKYAFMIFLIFSAIITPDGTGITMIMLSAPLAGLYFLGTIMATKNKSSA